MVGSVVGQPGLAPGDGIEEGPWAPSRPTLPYGALGRARDEHRPPAALPDSTHPGFLGWV